MGSILANTEDSGSIKIFSGNGNPSLAEEISDVLNIPLSKSSILRTSGGEKEVTIEETVRGDDVFIIQPTSTPISENILELLILTDAVRRASAKSITAVIPYFGYARQNRKKKPRDPIPAKLLANVFTAAGVGHVLTVDLHDKQVGSFFDIPLDHITCETLLSEYIRNDIDGDVVVVSPDSEGVSRAREIASLIDAPLAIVYRKTSNLISENVNELDVIGDVKGKSAVIVDDIVDTGNTAARAAEELCRRGAEKIYLVCTHAVFSKGATRLLESSPITGIAVTNTIHIRRHKHIDKLKVLSAAPLIAESIRRIHSEQSIGAIPDSILKAVKYEE